MHLYFYYRMTATLSCRLCRGTYIFACVWSHFLASISYLLWSRFLLQVNNITTYYPGYIEKQGKEQKKNFLQISTDQGKE